MMSIFNEQLTMIKAFGKKFPEAFNVSGYYAGTAYSLSIVH